jgi:hypothetical protein
MKRRSVRKPEEIIGEWGVRDVTPPSQAERRDLEADAEINPLVGRPLRRRIRNFTSEPDTYLASLGGPLPYMRRLREIERLTEQHLEALAEAYAEHRGDSEGWRAVAERWDFVDVNSLIEKHNRWFPTEARLRMDPRTRDFVKIGGRHYTHEPLDADWILEQFPIPTLQRP